MKLKFHGGAQEVGRSCVVVNDTFLLDAGLKIKEHNGGVEYPSNFNLSNIQAVFISHSHLDHVGALPMFNFEGLRCSVFLTRMTREISKIMLKDSYHIATLSDSHAGYSEENVYNSFSFMQTVKLNKRYHFGDMNFKFLDAGHIPGAASILLEIEGKKLLYSGDISHTNTHLVLGSDYHVDNVDILICESTYGDRLHENRQEAEKRFKQKILEAIERGGSVIIPVFAVGRAQEVILMLRDLPIDTPIYLDGMSKGITQLCLQNPETIKNANELRQCLEKIHFVKGKHHRKNISKQQGIIITTSGMVVGGAIMGHLPYYVNDDRHSILLTGYQGEDTNGRSLLENKTMIIDDQKYKWKGYIEKFDFSAHSGQDELIKYIAHINPKVLVLMHGEPASIKILAEKFPDKEVYTPHLDEELSVG